MKEAEFKSEENEIFAKDKDDDVWSL